MSNAFPSNSDDLFNKKVTDAESSDPSSWESPSNLLDKPRWTIKTSKEQQEQDNLIRVLEAKMSKVKQRGYTSEQMLHSAIETSYSDADSDADADSSDNEDTRSLEEEGLSLLWKTKANNLDEAIKQSKKENEYTSWLPGWLTCCCRG